LFAHALHLATEYPTTDVCSAVSESTRKVCSGEIVQTLRRGSTNVTLADYRRVIDLKTAELFRVSCLLGAQLSGSASVFAGAAASYGRHLGIAYQIYDDLADYFGEERKVGKTLGTDLASGKLTLPSIILAEQLPSADRDELMEELAGNRSPQLELRVRQMVEYGVFDLVSKQIQQELAAADSALNTVAEELPTPMLRELSDVLRGQVLALRSSTPN
ncbi:MAG TPA: polyprenyl synthetase family protein, partial [Opitutus sp.]|nr:polyprenyl synthetase family protein [Opitutus sp.]